MSRLGNILSKPRLPRPLSYLILFCSLVSIKLQSIWNQRVSHQKSQNKELAKELFREIPTYIINLDTRPDRWVKTSKSLKKMQITNWTRIPGVHDNYPKRGCAKAHLNCYKSFRESNSDVALICEDDVNFVGAIGELVGAVNEFLQDDSMKVFCVASLAKKTEESNWIHLLRTTNVQTASCYMVKKTIIDDMINMAERSIESLTKSGGKNVPIDKEWKKLQVGNSFVVSKRRLCVQRTGFSDIQQRRTWYNY